MNQNSEKIGLIVLKIWYRKPYFKADYVYKFEKLILIYFDAV